jgi:hypothetical protein
MAAIAPREALIKELLDINVEQLPFVRTLELPMMSDMPALVVPPSAITLADALPYAYFRSTDARRGGASAPPPYEWRFTPRESKARLNATIVAARDDGEVQYGGGGGAANDDVITQRSPAEAREVQLSKRTGETGAQVYSIDLSTSGAVVLRQHAGTYELFRCARSNRSDSDDQLVARFEVYVTQCIDTYVLPPSTRAVQLSVSPSALQGNSGTTTWLAIALDRRVQQMRRPALRMFNEQLRRTFAMLRSSSVSITSGHTNVQWMRNTVDAAWPTLDSRQIAGYDRHYNLTTTANNSGGAYSERSAQSLWNARPRLHYALLALLCDADVSVPLIAAGMQPAANALNIACPLGNSEMITLSFVFPRSADDDDDTAPQYATWIDVFERMRAFYEVAGGGLFSQRTFVAHFAELITAYTSDVYDLEPLYQLPDYPEFVAVQSIGDDPLVYALDRGYASRIQEHYDSPYGTVSAPKNILFVALRSGGGAANFTLANANVVAIAQVHVLPDMVVPFKGGFELYNALPQMVSDGVAPSRHDRAALAALSQYDPMWFRPDSDSVRRYWYAVPAEQNLVDYTDRSSSSAIQQQQHSVLNALARRLSTTAQFTGHVFTLPRSLSDVPSIDDNVDDAMQHGVLFVLVEEIADRVLLAQSTLLNYRANLNAITDSPLRVDDGGGVHPLLESSDDRVLAPMSYDAGIAEVQARVRFAPRRIRMVVHYQNEVVMLERAAEAAALRASLAPPPPPLSLFPLPPRTRLDEHWDDRLTPIRVRIETALEKLQAGDALSYTVSESLKAMSPSQRHQRALTMPDASDSVLDVLRNRMVDSVVYSGQRPLSLSGVTVAFLLDSLSILRRQEEATDNNDDDAVFASDELIERVPIVDLCARIERRYTRNGFHAPQQRIEVLLAVATVGELRQRFAAMWLLVTRLDAFAAINYPKDRTQVSLEDIDSDRLIQAHGHAMTLADREFVRGFHTAYIAPALLNTLIRFDLRQSAAASPHTFPALVRPAAAPPLLVPSGFSRVLLSSALRSIPPSVLFGGTGAGSITHQDDVVDELDALDNSALASAAAIPTSRLAHAPVSSPSSSSESDGVSELAQALLTLFDL